MRYFSRQYWKVRSLMFSRSQATSMVIHSSSGVESGAEPSMSRSRRARGSLHRVAYRCRMSLSSWGSPRRWAAALWWWLGLLTFFIFCVDFRCLPRTSGSLRETYVICAPGEPCWTVFPCRNFKCKDTTII